MLTIDVKSNHLSGKRLSDADEDELFSSTQGISSFNHRVEPSFLTHRPR